MESLACKKCTLFVTFFTFVTSLLHLHTVQAGSFYQRGFPDARSVQDSLYQSGYDFSRIQPLPVREILSNHGLPPSRNGKKFTPGSKVDVLFVDLNDIDEKSYASSPSKGRIIPNSLQARNFPNSINEPYNNRRYPKQFQQPSNQRNVQQEPRRKKIKVERVESLHAESNIREILKILPQIEAQIERFDRQERQNVSGGYENNRSNSENRKTNKNVNTGSASRHSKRTTSNTRSANRNQDRRIYTESRYYY